MDRQFWRTKTFWAAMVGILALAGTCFAFYVEAHPVVKAVLAFLTGVCGILEGVFVASRVSSTVGTTVETNALIAKEQILARDAIEHGVAFYGRHIKVDQKERSRTPGPLRQFLVACALTSLLASTGCNKLAPTFGMPFSKGWGAAVAVSLPQAVADAALLGEASAVSQPDKVVKNPDGSTTTISQPAVPPTPVLTINALDVNGAVMLNVVVFASQNKAKALCNAYCAGSHGWHTVWDARVHTLKTCPILTIGVRCTDCLVASYFKSEPSFRADYFNGAHSEKYKAGGKLCKSNSHGFGKDADSAEMAVACVLNTFTWWP